MPKINIDSPHANKALLALPTEEELQYCEYARSKCKKLIASLRYPDDDVIGDLRITRLIRAHKGSKSKGAKAFEEMLETRIADDHFVERARCEVIGMNPTEFVEYVNAFRHPGISLYFYLGVFDGMPHMMINPGNMTCKPSTDRLLLKGETISEKKAAEIALLNLVKLNVAVYEWHFHLLNNLSKEHKKMSYFITLGNFHGLASLKAFYDNEAFDLRRKFPSKYERMYENHDYCLMMINVPTFFRAIYHVFSLLLTSNQKAKIKICGSTDDPAVTKEIYAIADSSIFPPSLGGTGPSPEWILATANQPSVEYYMNHGWNYYKTSNPYKGSPKVTEHVAPVFEENLAAEAALKAMKDETSPTSAE